jgi:hypothetical protein
MRDLRPLSELSRVLGQSLGGSELPDLHREPNSVTNEILGLAQLF